ncbi:MAG: hypothetical protein ACOC34_01080 [Thermotogota bacterium]
MNLLTKNKKINAYILVPLYVTGVYMGIFALFSWGNWQLVSNALFGAAIIAVNISWVSLSRNLKKERKEQTKHKDTIGFAFLIYSGYNFMISLLMINFI